MHNILTRMVYIDEEGFKDSSDLKLQIQSGFFLEVNPRP